MRRTALLFLVIAGCATSRPSMKERCEENPDLSPKCIEILTAPADPSEFESREEVMRREQERKALAEGDRLERMRRDEEARQASRVGTATATATGTGEEELPEEDREVLSQSTGAEEETETGSSVRALVATHVDQKAGEPPTPEHYLRAAQCLAGADLGRMKNFLVTAKKRNSNDAGNLAITILEGDSLLGAVNAELEHRGLPVSGNGICAAETTRRVVDLLRELVGPPVTKDGDALPYSRGLGRLRKELEVRAGLPKSE